MSLIDQIESLVSPLCERLEVELVDVEYAGGVVRLTVDRPEGIGMDHITPLTREISRAFDHEDPISGAYTIEISSPGLERALKKPEHFLRAVGSNITIKTQPGTEGDRRVTGRLEKADDKEILVLVDGKESRTLNYNDILKARTVFDWSSSLNADRQNNETRVGSSPHSGSRTK
ncbi:MAG TPA: ribosome maturation factor RimP [Acidimicrobiales bacterium]|nr:ribosome maturation factor RimP [Acidimicrobiales bacterium]